MICKKCKTAAPEDVHECPHCRTPMNRGAIARKAIGILFIISIVALCILYLIFKPNLFPLEGEEEAAPTAGLTNPSPATENAVSSPTPSASLPPPQTADLGKGLEDVYAMLHEVYEGAAAYYGAYASDQQFISKHGFLYNITSNALVSAQTLFDASFLDKAYAKENVFIMFFAPSALAAYPELDFGDSHELALFAAYETKNGIALVSSKNQGILYREHFNALVDQYNASHGELRRPSANTAEYQNILNTVLSYDFIGEPVFVHYMAADDKYAAVVFSTASDSNVLQSFILENINGEYVVVLDHFENESRYRVHINQALPNLNISLLPSYDTRQVSALLRKDFTLLLEQLTADGMVTKDDAVTYSSGTSDYAYLTFASGKLILAYRQDALAQWSYREAANWLEAEVAIAAMVPIDPPLYIIWQK